MKRIVYLIISIGFVYSNLYGQTRPRASYFNIGYASEKLKPEVLLDGEVALKSKFGASLSKGRTYFLNDKPVAKMLYFGLDWSFIDLNYASFKFDDVYHSPEGSPGELDYEDMDAIGIHKLELGMQFGPSVHLSFKGGFSLSTYIRYSPVYSMLYEDSDFSGGFGNFGTAGIAANYSAFALGFENRWGTAKHNFYLDTEELEGGGETEKQKLKLNGTRVFFSLKF